MRPLGRLHQSRREPLVFCLKSVSVRITTALPAAGLTAAPATLLVPGDKMGKDTGRASAAGAVADNGQGHTPPSLGSLSRSVPDSSSFAAIFAAGAFAAGWGCASSLASPPTGPGFGRWQPAREN